METVLFMYQVRDIGISEPQPATTGDEWRVLGWGEVTRGDLCGSVYL